MSKPFLISIVLLLTLVGALFAQGEGSEAGTKLPQLIAIVLGALSATLAEFAQKQKSKLASLGIAFGISTVVAVVAAFITGVKFDFANLAPFIGQVWAYGTTVWATVFKGMGLSQAFGAK